MSHSPAVAGARMRRRIQRRIALAALGLALVAAGLPAADLTVEDGVVVKFGQDAGLVVRDRMAAGKGVVFTSSRDGAPEGTPAAGDWRGVRIEKSSASYGVVNYNDLALRYAGGGEAEGGAAFTMRGVAHGLQFVQVTDSVIGLRLVDGASPAITGSSFLRNQTGLEASNSQPTVASTQFVGNSVLAISNLTPATVIKATGNWWGHASGPNDPAANPAGQGDAVSAGVNYANHLAALPLINPTLRLAAPVPYFETRTIALDLSCVNATEFRVAENGNFTGVSYEPLPGGRTTIEFEVSAGDGRKTLGAQFRGPGGNVVSATLADGVLIDTEAPQVSITSPAPGSLVRDPITIEAAASDASGVASVQFFLGSQLLGTDTTAPYALAWDTDAVADGNYSIRVVATDMAGRTAEHSVSVTVSHGAPVPDLEGPELADIKAGNIPLADGATFSADSTLAFTASDRSAISRIELLLDGVVRATAIRNSSGVFTVPLSIQGLANGSYVLALRAFDSLGNVSTLQYTIQVSHAGPPAPVITRPANGTSTRESSIVVSGTALAGSTVQVLRGGVAAAEVAAGTAGTFSTQVELVPGANVLSATATNQYGTSAASAPVTVTLDTSVPTAPTGLTASLFNGRIRLVWTLSSDPNVVGYRVYRAAAPFEVLGEAQRVATPGQNTSSIEDLPDVDGTYYYRVVAVNASGTESLPTAMASASIDRTPPHVVSIEYTHEGTHDASRGVYGQGRLALVVEVSEQLLGTPYLSLVPAGGLPIPVELVRQTETRYAGSLTLAPGTGQGEANVLFSARDLAGNRGDSILAGGTLLIDTVGPSLTGIELAPAAPINAGVNRNVQATFEFDEDIPAATPPSFQYRLSGAGRGPVALGGVQRLSARRWRATLELPADAGANGSEDLAFDFVAADALGNSSSSVAVANAFQVYQGDLPSLNVPLGLGARARAGGQIALEWLPVTGATGYQVYRQGPGDAELLPLARSTGASHVDATPADGTYRYAVASVRQANGQESLSAMSPVAEATSSRVAPGAPRNLQLVLLSQGIGATWQPPVGPAPKAYRLYRAATSPISDVSGLTPVRDNIVGTQAIDPVPSQSEHAYVVTAIDAAGNESAVSNSAYLNFSLLPVRSIEVEQVGTSLPLLRWTPNGTGAVGFDVHVGEGEGRVTLTPTPTTARELVDTGFTAGERLYTVDAVDENGERQSRSLLLPNVSTQVVSGLPLKRNVMNRVGVQVSNLSAAALASARVVLTTGSRSFRSEEFQLAGNATRLVPVIVGGHADLPASTRMTVSVVNEPHEGERATVGRMVDVTAVDSALVVGMETDSFVRGATGKVRLVVENTSDVEVELLTARNFGAAASSELRLKLLDTDGNLVSTTPYRQATGAGVVTVPTGETVARIAPGQRYVSDTFQMPIPAASPDQLRLRLEVDALRYNTGQPDFVSIAGLGSERGVSLSNTPYFGQIESVSPVMSFGTGDVTITGRAVDRDSGDAVGNVPLRIAVNQEGFERLASVTTDASGAFRYVYKPTVTDSGLYYVGAIHPDMTDRPQQAQFTINRVSISPASFKVTVPRNYAYRIDFRAVSGAGTRATGVRLAYLAEYQSGGALTPGIQVVPGAPIEIGPKQNLALPVSISGDNAAPPSGRIFLAAFADGAAEPLAVIPVDYTLTEAKPVLNARPNYVEAGLSRGQSVVESVEIENRGFVAMENMTAALLDRAGNPAPSWIALASSPALGSIGVGEKRSLDLSIAPTELVAEGIHEFVLRVAGANVPNADINVFVSVTQSGQGNVLFKVADIYTATRDSQGNLIPGLAGARIRLQNELVASQTYDATTDAFGEAFFQGLPAGSYRFRASGPNHQDAGGRVVVRPGITTNQSVFLEYTLIQVDWTVREITIDDRYEITLEATFETDVPAAVVVLQPTSITLPPMAPGEVFQGELILTNYGLVRADDVTPTPPGDDAYFKFEFLATPPTSLEAKQRVRLPYRVIAVGSPGEGGVVGPEGMPIAPQPMSEAGVSRIATAAEGSGAFRPAATAAPAASSTNSGCYTYTSRYRVGCKYECANGQVSENCGSDATWIQVVSTHCPAGTRPGGGGSGGVWGGGGWGGSGGGNYSGLPGLPPCVRGDGDCFNSPDGQSGGGNEGGQ